MKKITIIIISIISMYSCTKDELERTKLFYDYEPNQELMINVEIIPTNNVSIEFKDMLEEVNADYYNRHGIGVNMTLADRIQLDSAYTKGNAIFIPKGSEEHIRLYIVESEVIKFRAYAYAELYSNSIILNQNSQTSRTLAHEIAHLLGLSHSEEDNNVMTPLQIANQYDVPNEFNTQQIDTVKNILITKSKNHEYKSIRSIIKQ